MCILTAVRTSLGPVYLVPHGTVIPPGDGSQKHSVRTTSWCTTAVEVEAQACGKCDHHFYPILETGTKIHMYRKEEIAAGLQLV